MGVLLQRLEGQESFGSDDGLGQPALALELGGRGGESFAPLGLQPVARELQFTVEAPRQAPAR